MKEALQKKMDYYNYTLEELSKNREKVEAKIRTTVADNKLSPELLRTLADELERVDTHMGIAMSLKSELSAIAKDMGIELADR